MKYEGMTNGGQYPYPSHNIDPKKKGGEWCMEYAKAAYYDFTFGYPNSVFANNGGQYSKYRMYALGKQPNSQYKTLLGVDNQTNNTWLSVDWSIRAIVSGYRDKAISRLMKENFSIVATPVDILAKNEIDNYYAKIKVKLAIRQLMMQQNPELASHPMISLQSGEPLDIEELEMRVELGEQFNRSKDAEMAIELGFYENGYDKVRRRVFEDLFDFGVAGVKDYLGDDNKAKFRVVNPECVLISYAKDSNFQDVVHVGEIINVPLVELATVTDNEGNLVFSTEDLQEFAASIAGKFGNPIQMGINTGALNSFDKFKCSVVDIEFFTYNDSVFMDVLDANGNSDFRKSDYNRGKTSTKYKRKKIQYVYKCKWVIGTDKYYDFGMCYDQKRSPNDKKKAQTKLSYHLSAYNFYEMKAQGFMERLVPYLDDYQLTMLKIQNFKNRAVPSGWWINLDALENVALTKGGASMQPKELLQMFFETGVLVGRSLDAAGNPLAGNVQPVIPIENTAASELQMFYQDLINTISMVEKMTGYNDITSGNPNPKTLVPGYQLANQSTNDALFPIAFSEECISLSLAEAVLCRMQQGLKKGKIEGYMPYSKALNQNTLRFIELNSDLPVWEFGIELQKKTTDDQKSWLLQQMQGDIANGYLDSSDAVILVNTHNVKEAQMIWAYRVKKSKERVQQNELEKIRANNEGANIAAQTAIEGDMMRLQMELKSKENIEMMRIQGELQKEQLRIESMERIASMNNQTKILVAADTGDAKENATEIAAHGSIAKQEIANQKQNAKLN